ncbi:MAG: DUF4038 domain-containing protein [Paraglaciecola sp.]|uniref:apiosidase-like domain-containing protein n=1 Tax=Paraglaciecola sp. TaxID=1920173 RepID=UPI003297A948
MKRYVIAIFSLILASPLYAESTAPWQQHGKLEVSKNSHIIQHSDKTPFLWVGDTGWAMFQQLTREEVDLYLDHRQKLGFNVIQAVAHWSPHGGGMKRSPDNAPNAYGHRPFTGDEQHPNTAEPLVIKGGTPQAPNDYWDNADYVINAVKKRNMYLALLPTWGSQLITGTKEYNDAEAKAYGTFLGRRYKNEPHIIWVLGGDTKAQFSAYDKNQNFSEYDNRSVYRAMAEGLAFGVTGKKVTWNEASSVWDALFMTYHPNGDYPYSSSQWFHNDPWLDANGVEVWKEVDDVYRAMVDDYQLADPIKPTLFLEGSYEYGTYRHECGWVTPLIARRQIYQTYFAGGAGHTYGAAPIWAMRSNGGDYNCGYTWQQALDFPGAKQFAVTAKAFLQEHKWYEWVPNGAVIGATGLNEALKTAVTTTSGNMALVYFANNSHTQVNNILNTSAQAYWFSPRDGIVQKIASFSKDESKSLAPPSKWEDAILVLKATL